MGPWKLCSFYIYLCTLAWQIPWMEEPGRLQSMGLLRSDTTERLHFHFSLSCIGEGNGKPLQCSCLENPRDGGAWRAAVCGSPRFGHAWSGSRSSAQLLSAGTPLDCTALKGCRQPFWSDGTGRHFTEGGAVIRLLAWTWPNWASKSLHLTTLMRQIYTSLSSVGRVFHTQLVPQMSKASGWDF